MYQVRTMIVVPYWFELLTLSFDKGVGHCFEFYLDLFHCLLFCSYNVDLRTDNFFSFIFYKTKMTHLCKLRGEKTHIQKKCNTGKAKKIILIKDQ